MSAILGNGREYDLNMKASALLKTTTSQYKAVGIVGETTSSDWTAELCGQTNTVGTPTATSRYSFGINQTYMSANSAESIQVRNFGLSKAICADSITAGQWVKAYEGVSTTTMAGKIVGIAAAGSSITGANMSVTAYANVLGRAVTSGQTNSVITIMVNPQLNPVAWI